MSQTQTAEKFAKIHNDVSTPETPWPAHLAVPFIAAVSLTSWLAIWLIGREFLAMF